MKPHDRWHWLWNRLACGGDPDAIFSRLAALYGESHRAYHNLDHIAACLDEFDPVRSLATNAEAVEFSIWFHDAIYDPRAHDNEERSAALAVTIAREANLPALFITAVTEFVLATKHKSIPTTSDARLVVDIDLAILGKPPAMFDDYERKIRSEYSFVPDDQFRAGRAVILKQFQARPTIYFTDYFRQRYEAQARMNLDGSLSKLL